MNQQPQTENKKHTLRNDSLLVCSMLAIYGVCILGFIGATLWGLDRRSTRISAHATSTAFAVATQNANATATMVARPTEQAKYAIVDPFNDNSEYWMTESSDDEFMVGAIAIQGGVYAWNMREVKQPFVYWANFRKNRPFEDFDVYVDSKIITSDGKPGDFCSGFVFRNVSYDLEEGTYTFSVCSDSYFKVEYYEKEKWNTISDWTYSRAIQRADWNRLEVSARGDHFSFIINNEVVFEMTDDRLSKGGIGLLVEVNEAEPVKIWFDNFGLQSR
jgi:hypothetical protein